MEGTKGDKVVKRLKVGDTIALFSPSTPITAICPNRYKRGKEFLESKGFKIRVGKLTGKRDFYRSGSIKERAEELNELIRDKEVRCIMSMIGGMNSNSILPYIDYEAFKKDPKIIIGLSDVTAILFAIYQKTAINTFYGPACVSSFGELEPFNEMTYKYFKDVLVDSNDNYIYEKPKVWTDEFLDWESQNTSKEERENKWQILNPGISKGRLVIGNLNTMSGIIASPFMINIKKGDILFIEDSLKDAATVERSFSMLKLAGVFDKISGLILGKHELYKDQGSGLKSFEILEEVLGDYDFPFIADVDCCHTHPMFTMEIGSEIILDANTESIKLTKSILK